MIALYAAIGVPETTDISRWYQPLGHRDRRKRVATGGLYPTHNPVRTCLIDVKRRADPTRFSIRGPNYGQVSDLRYETGRLAAATSASNVG